MVFSHVIQFAGAYHLAVTIIKYLQIGTFLSVQWLRLPLSMQEVFGSIPGQEAKIPHDLQPKNQNIKQKQQ